MNEAECREDIKAVAEAVLQLVAILAAARDSAAYDMLVSAAANIPREVPSHGIEPFSSIERLKGIAGLECKL